MPVINEAYELVSVSALKPHPRNARKGDVGAISDSIDHNGFFGALVVQKSTRHILAGNHRYLAAKSQNMSEVPVLWVDVDDQQALKILLADNRTNDIASYDDTALAELLAELSNTVGLEGTGYSSEDLDELIGSLADEGGSNPDEAPEAQLDKAEELREKWGVEYGQLWEVGRHRILCGDSTKAEDVARLMDGKKADMVWADPPYNVDFAGTMSSTSVQGKVVPFVTENAKHDAIHNDKKSEREFNEWMQSVLAQIKEWCTGAWYICFSSANLHEILNPLLAVKMEYKSIICWVKNQSPMGGGAYRRRYEPIVYGNFSGDFYGEPYAEDDVWEFDRTRKNDLHPTMKPVDLVQNAVQHGSKKGGSVFDPFSGSGTGIVAAEQTKRICYGMELEPKYVAVTLQRLADMGLEPRLIDASGQTNQANS